MAAVQHKSQWCWAASIAMIFSHHGHVVHQERIVHDAYGKVEDLPAASGSVITNALSKIWTDQEGIPFAASTVASDDQAKLYPVTPLQVLAELAAGRPLLLGAQGHAVVLVGLQFERLANGSAGRITAGTVVDPSPGHGKRGMAAAERKPTYLAAVHITALVGRIE